MNTFKVAFVNIQMETVDEKLNYDIRVSLTIFFTNQAVDDQNL